MRRLTLPIAFIVTLASVLAGCGQQSKQYASSNIANTYFTVPNEWREIPFEKLAAYEKSRTKGTQAIKAESVLWQVAFTPLKKLKLSQVYSIQSFDEPIVVARVRNLTYQEGNNISYNVLRDIIIPLQTWSQDPTKAPTGFSVIGDYEIYDQGVRGIRSIFTFDNDGVNETIDQVAMVSNDRRTLYVLLSRCNTVCYQKNQKVIDQVVKSFTVKGKK